MQGFGNLIFVDKRVIFCDLFLWPSLAVLSRLQPTLLKKLSLITGCGVACWIGYLHLRLVFPSRSFSRHRSLLVATKSPDWTLMCNKNNKDKGGRDVWTQDQYPTNLFCFSVLYLVGATHISQQEKVSASSP